MQKATDAKNETEKGQEKEIVALAYNSALAKKVGNGDSTPITSVDMNIELTNQGASAKGSNPITVTFTDSRRQYTINSNGAIDYAGVENNNENNIQLSYKEIETESRAVILEVAVDKIEVSTATNEEKTTWLKTLSANELKEVYAQSQYGIGEKWSSHYNGAPFTDVKSYYDYTMQYVPEEYRNPDEYDWMIKSSSINNANLDILYYYTTNNIELPKNITLTCNDESKTVNHFNDTKAEFVIVNNGNYMVTANNEDGDTGKITVEISKCKIEQYTKISTVAESGKSSKTITALDSQNVEVPAGFYYGISENVGKVNEGFVITDSVDSNGYSIGNEFVWVPINYNFNNEEITVYGTNKKMSELSTTTDYNGILYSFPSSGGSNLLNGTYNPKWFEPDVVSSDTGSYSSQGITKNLLQSEYNTMIESIKKYGGFYVARYEMSVENNIATSKLGVVPASANDSTTKMWYGLYKMAKTYSTDSIQSNMIWTSQYHAMLNFALTNSVNANRITSDANGNHNRSKLKTGTTKTANGDKINNIFDLEGNMFEWSLAVYKDGSTENRVYHGGSFNTKSSTNYIRNAVPYNTSQDKSTRLSLYIK